MPGIVGQLIAAVRRGKRPQWSQQFLADELERLGFPITRNQIARLESSDATDHPDESLAPVAVALGIDVNAVAMAVSGDYRVLHEQIRQRIARRRAGMTGRRKVAGQR